MEKESNQIAGNVANQMIVRFIVLALALISIKLVTNYLGPEGTGYYNTIITFFTFLITIADLGLFTVGVREISKTPEKTRKILNNIFALRLVSAILATAIAVVIVFLTNYPPQIKLGVLAAAAFPIFNLTSSIYDIYFQHKLEMQKAAIAELVAKIMSILTIYLTVTFNLGFYFIVASVSVSAAVIFIIKYLFAQKKIKINFEGIDLPTIRWILKLSLPLGVVFIVNNFYFKVDTLILFYIKGATDVGIYSVAYKILETSMFAAAFLVYSLKPLLSVSVEVDRERTSRATTKGLTFLLFTSLAIVIFSLPFSKEIIIFLSNQSFLAGAPVLIILALTSVVIYFNILFGEIMIAKDLRRYLLFVAVFVLLFNIITNIIFIPKYSYMAAAYITMASEILLLLFGAIKVSTFVPLRPDFWRITKLLFCATLAILLGFWLKSLGLYFVFSVLIILPFYFLLSYLIDAVPKNMINDYLLSIRNRWIGQNYQS